MVKYLSVAFFINLILFSLYSYWISNAMKRLSNLVPKELPPLIVSIKTEKVKFEELKKRKIEKNRRYVKTVNRNTAKNLASKPNPTPKPSLIDSLSQEIKKEFSFSYRKVTTKTSATLSQGGNVKLFTKRKLIYIPKIGPIKVSTPPAPVEVKITVLPDGRVIKAVLIKKSGNPKIDSLVLNFSKNLRFEPINEPIIQEIYISYNFTLK